MILLLANCGAYFAESFGNADCRHLLLIKGSIEILATMTSLTMPTSTGYKLILDGLHSAVLVLDQNLNVQYINPACETLFAVSEKRVINQPISSLFVDDQCNDDSLLSALQSGHSYIKREASIERIGLDPVIADYYVIPMLETDQAPGLLLEFRPLDRLMRISKDDALRNNQVSNRSLIRGIAHEVKNPLGGIRGAAQLLERTLPEEQQEYTQVIIREVDRLRNLVDQMLGPRNISKQEPVNIHEVLERVRSVILAEAHDQIKIIRNYDTSLPELKADKDQLIQALLNIVRNAYQALVENKEQKNPCIVLKTRVNRQFTIGSTRHRLAMQIDIIDNGPGIPQELLESIFYPMVSGRAEGSGLGLSISQSIIDHHHGLIESESEAGKTCFSVILPLG